MVKKSSYYLNRKSIYKKYLEINVDSSYNMNKKKDNESIGIIKFYDNKIINKVIKKSIDLRFKKLLELMISIEESDEDPSSGLLFCLDEADRFKHEMINKYKRFLKKEQMELLNKKIELIEKEVKDKLIAYRLMHTPIYLNQDFEDEVEEEMHRRR